jgi:hypothetical protein
MSPYLPHHRRGPRIEERFDDPDERAIVKTAIAIGYVAGVLLLVYLAAIIAGTV